MILESSNTAQKQPLFVIMKKTQMGVVFSITAETWKLSLCFYSLGVKTSSGSLQGLPFHQMHTENHQEIQSLCSGNQCDQCGWSSACSWPGSTPGRQVEWTPHVHHEHHRVQIQELCSHQQILSSVNVSANTCKHFLIIEQTSNLGFV